jgi:hypothetical protein
VLTNDAQEQDTRNNKTEPIGRYTYPLFQNLRINFLLLTNETSKMVEQRIFLSFIIKQYQNCIFYSNFIELFCVSIEFVLLWI